jgi:hypothetical protein
MDPNWKGREAASEPAVRVGQQFKLFYPGGKLSPTIVSRVLTGQGHSFYSSIIV